MRSIRRSMTGYLLLLLAVALGVVGVVIDQLTRRAMDARESAAVQLIQARFEERSRNERQRIDQVLLLQARELGHVMQTQYLSNLQAESLKLTVSLGLAQLGFARDRWGAVSAALAAPQYGVVSRGRWVTAQSPFLQEVRKLYYANLHIDDNFIRQSHFFRRLSDDEMGTAADEDLRHDYFQINTPTGRIWRSRTLETDGLTLPFDGKAVESGKVIDWTFADVRLPGGVDAVRRVFVQMPLLSVPPAGPRPGGGGPGGGGPGPPGGGGPGWPSGGAITPPTPAQTLDAIPRIYIQCARPRASIEKVLDAFADEREEQLATVRSAVQAERGWLRASITAIGVFLFLSIAVGGPMLVSRGLRPVNKLSDAVSQVSEKDFRLHHDGSELPLELIPIHARLTQTLDQLRRAFAREKEAVADISHELRTPIASLLATIDVALRKPRTPEQYRLTLDECRAITRQLSQLVERIMTLANLDAGTARTTAARVDAAEVADSCAAVMRPIAANLGLSLHVDADGPLELDTDPDKLREVLINLLHNAVEYNQPDGRVELTGRRDGDRVVLVVRDTGIGMTPEVRERIFERFFRADPSRQATGVHVGLGLAIVKEYVERLNGTIDVASEPGVGTTFRVSFPAAPSEAPPTPVVGPKSRTMPLGSSS